MKVQSNKPESHSQITARSDVASTISSDESSDFFAAMIANVLSNPISLPEEDNVSDTSVQIESENEETTQLANEKPVSSSQLMSELMVNLLNASMIQANDHEPAQSNPSSDHKEAAAPAARQLLTPFYQMPNAKDIEKPSQVNSEMLRAQDIQLQQLSDDLYQQMQSETLAQSINHRYEDTNPLLDNDNLLQAAAAASLFKNDMQNKMTAYQQVKNQRNLNEIALQLKNSDKVSDSQYVVANQSDLKQEQVTTVYHSHNGKINYQSDTKNNYIDALVEMNGIINSKTSNLINNDKLIFNAKPDVKTDYLSTARNINLSEYELNIELLPQVMDSSGKEMYQVNIEIHPPELGAVIAKLKIDKNNAELVIVAENIQVKSIVEANLSQLRENLQKHDINITNVHIDIQNPQSSMSEQGNKEQHAQHFSENTDQAADLHKQTEMAKKEVKQKLNSLIDTYA